MELIHNLYNLTNTFIIILINNTILHRFSIKTAAAELAPSEANHMAGEVGLWTRGRAGSGLFYASHQELGAGCGPCSLEVAAWSGGQWAAP